MRAGAAAVLVAVLTLTGCELTSIELADVADVVVAEVYLRPDVGIHIAFLHRTRPGPDGSFRVDGADVVVRRAGAAGAMGFEPAPLEVCASIELIDEGRAGSCYAAAADAVVRAGETYDLEIHLPDGGRLDGRTTIPGNFQVVSPAAPACLLEETALEMAWTWAAGAWAYQADALFSGLAEGLAARGVAEPPDTLRLLGLALGGADTTMLFPRDFGVFDRFELDLEILLALQDGLPEGARVDLVVAAADRNYVNWARGGNFNPSGQVRVSSLTGDGTGVFAALLGQSRVIHSPGGAGEGDGLPSCNGTSR